MTIDIQSYAGELTPPAAVEATSPNTYQQIDSDFPILPPEPSPIPESPEGVPVVDLAPKEDVQERNFKALSDSVERLKAEKENQSKEFQNQLDMLRANLSREQREIPKVKQFLDGMEDSDVPNVGELRNAWKERESAYNERIAELQFQSEHPDYAEVLQKYGKTLAQNDPLFVQGVLGAQNKALFAYQYAKREQRLQELESAARQPVQQSSPQPSAIAQKIVENSRKPGNLAQAGGQGVLSKADYYASMNDSDFMQFATKHLESI